MIRSALLCVLAWNALAESQTAPGSTVEIRKPDKTVADADVGKVSAVAFNQNGSILATVGDDKVVKLWDVSKGVLAGALAGYTGRMSSVAFSKDGKMLAAGSEKEGKVWDVATGKIILSLPTQLEGAGAKVWSAFRRDGRAPIAEADDGVMPWDADIGALLRPFHPIGAAVTSAGVSVNHLGAAHADGKVKLWVIDSPEAPRVLIGQKSRVTAIAFSPDGAQMGAAGRDGTIKVWDVKTGTLLASLEGHSGEVLTLAFSPNGRTIASGGADRSIRYWTMPLPPIAPEDLQKIEAAASLVKATVKPKKPRKLLVFWRADAIQHKGGAPAANKAIELLAKKTGAFEVHYSREYEVLDPKILSQYDAILMNSTAHLAIPDEAKKQALLDYVKGGGGVVGVHAAIDTFKDWPDGAEVIGATFGGHPFVPSGTWGVKIEEPDHPLTRAFHREGFKVTDEVYEMGEPYTRSNRRVLMSLDLSDPATAAITLPRPGKESIHRADKDFAVSWVKRYGAGKVFYGVFGHVIGPFQNPAILQFYLDGIQYALGDLDADDTPK